MQLKKLKDLQKIMAMFTLIFFILALIYMPQAKILSLHTTYFDLGIFETYSFLLEGSSGKNNFLNAGHMFFYFPIFDLFANIFPPIFRPSIYVGLQSLLLIFPIPFIYRYYGIFFSLAYILYAPVWSNALFDFHFDHLAVPLMLGYYLMLINGRIVFSIIFAILIAFIKEPFALVSAGCGLLLIVVAFSKNNNLNKNILKEKNKTLVIGGASLVFFGILYFYLSVKYLIPYFNYGGAGGFNASNAFDWLGTSLEEIILTVAFKPQILIYDIFNSNGKLKYLAIIFGALAFIPLFSPKFLIPALPLLCIAMLSHSPNHYDFSTHYTAGLIIPLIFSFIYGFQNIKFWLDKIGLKFYGSSHKLNKEFNLYTKFIHSLSTYFRSPNSYVFNRFACFIFLWLICANIFLSFSPISRFFWSEKTWSYSWRAYVPSDRDSMIKNAILDFIPLDPNISVSTQNTVNNGYLARRNMYFVFPQGVLEPIKIYDLSGRKLEGLLGYINTQKKMNLDFMEFYADYIVIDMKRPYFVIDQGCEWVVNKCKNGLVEDNFLSYFSDSKLYYETVFEQDGFYILKRNPL